MHYCFLLPADLDNPGTLRMQRMGAALIELGVKVSYILDDNELNRRREGIHPAARVEFVPKRSRLGEIIVRRRALKALAPDYVEVLNPHPKTLFALARLKKIRVVALWDEPRFMHRLGPIERVTSKIWHRWLMKRAWLKVVAARYLQDMFRRRWGLETIYLPHVMYVTRHNDGPSPFESPTAVYMGVYWSVWDHSMIFEAARLLKARGKTPPICMVGGGLDQAKWEQFVRDEGLTNVRITGFLPEEDMWRHLRHAQVLLFPMRDHPLNRARCSSKLFAYAQASRPIVGCRIGEAPQILGEKPIWIECTPEAFAGQIERLTSMPMMPDVDYEVDRLKPSTRARELLQAIAEREKQDTATP